MAVVGAQGTRCRGLEKSLRWGSTKESPGGVEDTASGGPDDGGWKGVVQGVLGTVVDRNGTTGGGDETVVPYLVSDFGGKGG